MKSRTETRALLAWFLENYYRLEDLEVFDSVCDGSGDKGIDGIYVNNQLRQIDFFQVTLFKSGKKTLGDAKLKQFCGAIAPELFRLALCTRETRICRIPEFGRRNAEAAGNID
jgi:hypothetical protein